jgi:hypothetical protein
MKVVFAVSKQNDYALCIFLRIFIEDSSPLSLKNVGDAQDLSPELVVLDYMIGIQNRCPQEMLVWNFIDRGCNLSLALCSST